MIRWLFSLFFLLLLTVNSFADAVIFVAPYGVKNATEKIKIISDKLKDTGVKLFVVRQLKDGSFQMTADGKTEGRAVDLFYVLSQALDNVKEEEKIWLFFSGDNGGDKTLLFWTQNRPYSIGELIEWMKIINRDIYFTGFDIPDFGIENLIKLGNYTYYAAETNDSSAFMGIYNNIDKLTEKPSSIPVKVIAYFQLYVNEIISKENYINGTKCMYMNITDNINNILDNGAVCVITQKSKE